VGWCVPQILDGRDVILLSLRVVTVVPDSSWLERGLNLSMFRF
jgi:hypothetical protein